MAILKVARMGHPLLRAENERVSVRQLQSAGFQAFIEDMIETMQEYDGVGLAAPQVHTNFKLLVMERIELKSKGLKRSRRQKSKTVPGEEEGVLVLANPVVEILTDELGGMWEGCLSLPGLNGYVERAVKIRVNALDRHGKKLEMELEGFQAVILQHELDHLEGVLFVDRLADPRFLAYSEEYQRFYAKGTEEEEEDTAIG